MSGGAGTILVVQHEDDCPPALFGGWLSESGCRLDVCRPYADDDLPVLDGYDGLLVLGGPMGADDDSEHHWLGPTKDRIRAAVETRLPTLGICLGHQLIASALGGEVTRNPHGQQLGLLDIGWTGAARDDALFAAVATPRRGVQWNDDVVARLPEGATLIAGTARGEIQAARFAPRTWGVQLHPEVDTAVLRPWAASDKGSHEAAGIDQESLLGAIDAAREELDAAWRPLAASFAEQVAFYRAGRRG
ncbi:type 1 glutamine amidotransferase [Nocardioides sp.]|uniref:type 1 glutamine amidotransferase n=1 Tax=Nocardioides sp. TaxID=35761 RepID=UPI0031FF3B7F|nr:glutamine amidotransferase class-I [Nocardioides sp.]